MQVYSQKTGRLQALLLDEGILTELRTAAVGALAAKLLCPKSINCIGIMGSGVQARYQLEMLASVTDCRNVLVWGRTPSNVAALVEEYSKGWNISTAETPDQLLQDCDLIITTTPSREPILGMTSLETRKSGLTIVCIGGDAPGKHELNPALVQKADLLVADTIDQTVERGEFQMAVADSLVKKESLVPLGQLILQEELHRNNDDDNRFIIFDSSGVALQDCVVSSMVLGG